MMSFCPICESTTLSKKKLIQLPFFKSSDFGVVEKDGILVECGVCGIVLNQRAYENPPNIQALLKQKTGSHTSLNVPTATIMGNISLIESKVIGEIYKSTPNRVLNFMCNDHLLISHLQDKMPNTEFIGYDPDLSKRSNYGISSGIKFYYDYPDQIEGPFDVIIVSNAMMCLEGFNSNLSLLCSKLSEEGFIWFRAPAVDLNPMQLLLADQYRYFTSESISAICSSLDLNFKRLGEDLFPGDVAGIIVQEFNPEPPTLTIGVDAILDQLLQWTASCTHLSTQLGNNLGILGQNVNASFVNEILGEKISYFCDENVSADTATFRGKPVVHPSTLKPNDCVIIPYTKGIAKPIHEQMGVFEGKFLFP